MRSIKKWRILLTLRYRKVVLLSILILASFLFGIFNIFGFLIDVGYALIGFLKSAFLSLSDDGKVTTVLAIVGGVLASVQWLGSRKEKRAEFLGGELHQLWDKNAQLITSSAEFLDESKTNEYLVALGYVCYLRNTGIITNAEMSSFDSLVHKIFLDDELVRVLTHKRAPENSAIYHLLKYVVKSEVKTIADFALDFILDGYVEESAKEGLVAKLSAKEAMKFEQRDEIDQIVEDGERSYRTHLDILNGVFGLNLSFHMRGGHKLNNGALVWFPKIVKSADRQYKTWQNTIVGNMIHEYWPSDMGDPSEDARRQEPMRIVYAYRLMGEDDNRYRFIGIYKYKSKDKHEHCFVYERVAAKFNPKDFYPNVKTPPKTYMGFADNQ